MENHAPDFGTKLMNVVKAIVFILKKGKEKLMLDFNLMHRRMSKLAGKSLLRDLVLGRRRSAAMIGGRRGKGTYEAQFESVQEEMEAINNALEVMSLSDAVAASPAFRRGTRVRVTDSPYEVGAAAGGDGGVDKDAEEFIRRFYSQIRRQPLTED